MATPIDQRNGTGDGAIFRLPDELLTEIFSYITRISKKMELEQVSQRFRFVSSQSISWKGIHKLELLMKCCRQRNSDRNDMKMKGACRSRYCRLNHHYIPVRKWSAAVQLLIDRTQIHQLFMHCGSEREVFYNVPTILSDLLQIFTKNRNKVNIEFIEFHYVAESLMMCRKEDPSPFRMMRSFLFDTLNMSVPYLKELVLNMGDESFGKPKPLSPIWPVVKKCQNLQSIAFSGSILNFDASVFAGKPLNKVVMHRAEQRICSIMLMMLLNS